MRNLLLLLLSFSFSIAQAQHAHHIPAKKDTSSTQKKDTMGVKMKNMDHTDHSTMQDMDMSSMTVPMSHSFSLNLPMNRNGSGTGWLPDVSPMYGYMIHSKKWMYMIHGNIFIRYNKQDLSRKGSRGGEKWDAPNWLMFMGQTAIGKKGLFHFSTMFSADDIIAGGSGYPLLFQSGETYKRKPLVDRQHPHDLFSELSVGYTHAFSSKSDLSLYLGYPGEPALGSVAFMHRPSALDNPDAPISHHWNDATHITFGVATLGYRYDRFKLEVSSFTGREPNENRYNFDKPRFDSWSGRLLVNPDKYLSFQVSHGFIKSPEEMHTTENVNRTTASAIFSHPLKKDSWLNATALWAVNKQKEHDGENAVLLEGSLGLRRLSFHVRYEWVQKSVEELVLDENVYGHDAVFPVNAFTVGLDHTLLTFGSVAFKAGTQFTFYHTDRRLDNLYGKNPMAFQVYLRINPTLMRM